jgi:thioredoxin 2
MEDGLPGMTRHAHCEKISRMSLIADRQGVRLQCPHCGKTNRHRYEHLDRTIRCGHCHTTLAAPGAPVQVQDAASFDAIVRHASVPVVVDFWAPWCAPCRTMAPEFETAARNLAGRALLVKVDTEALPDLGERFRIRSIPTLAVFRNGREISRDAGARPAAAIQALVA